METTVKKSEGILGEIETVIAGTEHAEATVRLGETVQLIREPGNAHDHNAVRVDNARDQKVGYVPRRVVFWLAPLMDRDYIRVRGRVPGEPSRDHDKCPLTLTVVLSKSGKALLRKNANPQDSRQALHQVVLEAFRQAERWEMPGLPAKVAELLQAAAKEGALPETRLLLSLFPYVERKGREARSVRILNQAKTAMRGVRIGAPIQFENLSISPLFAPNGHERDYLLVEEALEMDSAEVREVSEQGSVPELLFVNSGSKPVLIPEGEILVGAKQNRVVNLTVIVGAHMNFKLPVSCVEQGRWTHVSRNFEVKHYAPPSLRARKTARVHENMARMGTPSSHQGEVWDDVACCLRESGASSRTASLTEAFEAAKKKIRSYRENLTLPEDATGAMVVVDGRVVGVELFDSPKSFRRVWPRLSEAYYLEASTRKAAESPAPAVSPDEFWQSLSEKWSRTEEPVGLGVHIKITEKDLVGSAVWFNNRLCQMSALVMPEMKHNDHTFYDDWHFTEPT